MGKVQSYVVKSVGNLDTREKLQEIFSYLDTEDLRVIGNKLNIYIPDEDNFSDSLTKILTGNSGLRMIAEEILIFFLVSRTPLLDQIQKISFYPDEKEVFNSKNRVFEYESYESTQKIKQKNS